MEDSDYRPKQVEGFEVFSHITALLGTLHQLIDRSLDQGARTFIEAGRSADDAVESGRNDVLGRDVIDKQQHPASQGFDRGLLCGELVPCRGQLFDFTAIDCLDQRVSRGEMAIQSTSSHARVLCDFVEAGIRAVLGKSSLRHFENALAVAQRVRSRLSLDGLGTLLLHRSKFLQPEAVSEYLLIRRQSPFYCKQ
jgi:hypothetical protein